MTPPRQPINFLPHSEQDRAEMLRAIGLASQSDLFADIPQSIRENITYQVLPQTGLCELALQQELKRLAEANDARQMVSFLGGGAYHRFIPMAVNTIASRSEFYTAYTPYQPEFAQGTLQVGYEFQSMIAELTGMDVANAAVYDGGTAVAEAAFMAVRITKRKTIRVAKGVHPHYRQITQTYVEGLGEVTLETIDPSAFDFSTPCEQTACVVVQQPNFFGALEDLDNFRQFCEASGALFIVSADPVSLGVLQAPGAYGADIVVGDIQPLGNNLSYGGPYGGYMACKEKLMRQLPGRLVGKTVDKHGRPCYTLTLQTREQHIRREKATSNICTSQTLNVLKATVYMSLMGPNGLAHIATLSAQRAHTLANRLTELPGVSLLFGKQPFFSEFALQLPVSSELALHALSKQGILGGIALDAFYPEYPNTLLISTTELTQPEHLDRYVTTLSRLLENPAAAGTTTELPKKFMGVC